MYITRHRAVVLFAMKEFAVSQCWYVVWELCILLATLEPREKVEDAARAAHAGEVP